VRTVSFPGAVSARRGPACLGDDDGAFPPQAACIDCDCHPSSVPLSYSTNLFPATSFCTSFASENWLSLPAVVALYALFPAQIAPSSCCYRYRLRASLAGAANRNHAICALCHRRRLQGLELYKSCHTERRNRRHRSRAGRWCAYLDTQHESGYLTSAGTLACSPFHVRFGKFQLLRPSDKKVW
jgi:hypothetical protein